MLKEQFQQFLELSARLRPAFVTSLGQGADRGGSSIRELMPDAPELLQVIYDTVAGTGSGVEEPELIECIPGYRLIHIDEYAAETKVLHAALKEKGQAAGGSTVLPLLTNYGSDFICYVRTEDGEEQICDLLHDYGDLIVMYDSPENFLATLCEFYREGVYFLDEEGFLDCDLVREGEVGAELNPGAKYWTE